jgi:hypothetical protein
MIHAPILHFGVLRHNFPGAMEKSHKRYSLLYHRWLLQSRISHIHFTETLPQAIKSHTLQSLNNLIELYEAWGKPEKAEEWRARLPQKQTVGQ